MSLVVVCGRCGRRYNLNERYAGLTVRCKECGAEILVPAAAARLVQPGLDDLLAAHEAAPALPVTIARAGPMPPKWESVGLPAVPRRSAPRRKRAGSPRLVSPAIWLLGIGYGTFLLPLVGLQWKVMNVMGAAQPILGLLSVVVGAALLLVALRDDLTVSLPGSGITLGLGLLLFIFVPRPGAAPAMAGPGPAVPARSSAYPEAEALLKELLAALNEVARLMQTIVDVDTWQAARGPLLAISGRFDEFGRRAQAIQSRLTASEDQELGRLYLTRVQQAADRATNEAQQVVNRLRASVAISPNDLFNDNWVGSHWRKFGASPLPSAPGATFPNGTMRPGNVGPGSMGGMQPGGGMGPGGMAGPGGTGFGGMPSGGMGPGGTEPGGMRPGGMGGMGPGRMGPGGGIGPGGMGPGRMGPGGMGPGRMGPGGIGRQRPPLRGRLPRHGR